MRILTQKDIDEWPINEDRVKEFPANCSFGKWSRFGERSSFGEGCSFGKESSFGEGCSFGEGSNFIEGCSFGRWSRFGEMCSFGKWCRFGEMCNFGEGCVIEKDKNLIENHILIFNGFGSDNRCTYVFRVERGIYIRCGCWAGWVDKFKEKVKETHGDSKYAKEYLKMCELIEIKYGIEGETNE